MILSGVILITILSLVSLNAIEVGDDFPICVDPLATQYESSISGDIVVWTDVRNGNFDIYGYDLSTGTEFPICTQGATQENPAVSGDIVVWTDMRNGNFDIYGYNLSTEEEFPICINNPGDQLDPAISGSIVVWKDYRTGTYEIYGIDLSKEPLSEFLICSVSGVNLQNPSISGDIVVWVGNGNIYCIDLSESSPTASQISPNASTQLYPCVSGNTIVWVDNRNGNFDIYGYDLPTGTEFPICTQGAAQYNPFVSGNIVVWKDGRSASYDIYGYNLPTGTEFPICTQGAIQENPSISGDIVVWDDYRNGNYDIYGAQMNPPRASTASSEFSFRPVANTLLVQVNTQWNSALGSLPNEVPDEDALLIQDVQKHIANAGSLSNPVYSAGELYKALKLIEQIYEPIE